jgi:3-phenylpropionate/cinnamic acid dioxygenase small subunit
VPKSGLRRLISNVEVLEPDERTGEDDVRVGANFVVYESRERGITLWAGRVEYHLRRSDDGWRMSYKKVMLVDNDRALNTLAFLI